MYEIIYILCGIGAGGVLFVAAWQDRHTREVYDIYSGGFCVCCAIMRYLQGGELLAFAIVCGCLITLALPNLVWMGGADIAIILGLWGLYGAFSLPIVLFWISFLTIVIYLIERKVFHSMVFIREDKYIPLVPVIVIAVLPIYCTLNLLGPSYGW